MRLRNNLLSLILTFESKERSGHHPAICCIHVIISVSSPCRETGNSCKHTSHCTCVGVCIGERRRKSCMRIFSI